MKNMYKIMIVILVGLGIIYYRSDRKISQLNETITSQNKLIDSLTHVNDSIFSEISRLEIDLGRYEVADELLHQENPDAAREYDKIMHNIE